MTLHLRRCAGVFIHAFDDRNDSIGMVREYSIQPLEVEIREWRFIEGLQEHHAVANQMLNDRR